MSTSKPVQKTIVFEDPKAPGTNNVAAVVTFSSAKLVKGSNYFELRDGNDKTVVHLTWPSTLKPREI